MDLEYERHFDLVTAYVPAESNGWEVYQFVNVC